MIKDIHNYGKVYWCIYIYVLRLCELLERLSLFTFFACFCELKRET